MAATAVQTPGTVKSVPGASYYFDFVITGDAAYPTGGYPLTAATFPGMVRVSKVIPYCFAGVPGTAAADFALNTTTGNLQFITSAGAEVAAGTNLSGVSVRCQVHGA